VANDVIMSAPAIHLTALWRVPRSNEILMWRKDNLKFTRSEHRIGHQLFVKRNGDFDGYSRRVCRSWSMQPDDFHWPGKTNLPDRLQEKQNATATNNDLLSCLKRSGSLSDFIRFYAVIAIPTGRDGYRTRTMNNALHRDDRIMWDLFFCHSEEACRRRIQFFRVALRRFDWILLPTSRDRNDEVLESILGVQCICYL
jgi:hypothetical protein